MFNDPTVIGCTWTDLCARLDAAGTVTRWANTDVDLAGLATLDELYRASQDRRWTNDVLLALVRLAAVDGARDDDALLVLLHLLSGVVWRLVRQFRDLGDEVPAVVLAELTCQIRTYRLKTWTGSVVTTLELQTRRAVLDDLLQRDRHHAARCDLQLFDGSTWLAKNRAAQDGSPQEFSEDIDVVDMLLWVARQGVPLEDLELLLASERARGTYGSRADLQTCTERGLSRSTFMRRRARALSALRELAPAYLVDVA
jgi:hypothetical protein